MVTAEKAVHECEFLSECCGARAIEETDICGGCRDHSEFYCECEVCGECGEVRRDEDGELDARIRAGMKCGWCAYG
jgi:hypothetical protein